MFLHLLLEKFGNPLNNPDKTENTVNKNTMGGCCSKIDDEEKMVGPNSYFFKSQEDPLRFYLQADFIRAKEKHKALEINMKEEFFKVNLKLMPSTGYLDVKLTGKEAKNDLRLNVAVLLLNDKIELLTTMTKEDTKIGGKTASVSFPMAALVSLNPFISFIIVAVSVRVGGHHDGHQQRLD